MKTVIIYFLFLVFLLSFFSCSNPSDSEESPIINVFQTPIVTGLRITNMDSPEVIGIWGNPSDSPVTNSTNYPKLSKYFVKSSNSNSTHPLKHNSIPNGYIMHVPYPNPNDGATVISFALPIKAKVNLNIVRARYVGQKDKDFGYSNGAVYIASSISPVRELLKNKILQAGVYKIVWHGKDNFGNQVTSGFFRVFFSTEKYSVYRDIFLFRSLEDIPISLKKLIRPSNP